MKENGIEPIDMVIVNLYPFEEVIKKENVELSEAIENIDIGGPTLLRAAAKNYEYVTLVTDPEDYKDLLKELKKNKGAITPETNFRLAVKAFSYVARYDAAISNFLGGLEKDGGKNKFPATITMHLEKKMKLRYGENPHQEGSFYVLPEINEPCISNSDQIQGKELSLNNIYDTDAALEAVKDFRETACVIVKHNNPCGVATDESIVLKYCEILDEFIRVRATAEDDAPRLLSGADVKSRAGVTRKIAFPRVIPHSDGAGEIDRVGEGVPPARLRERVWVWNGQWRRPFGTAAQWIVLPAEQAVPLPANIGMEAGACLGIPAYTGYQAVGLAGAKEGSTVLVAAGAGAVGHYAIQFAKRRKATVIATVSSPAKAEIAQQAGADHVIDYRRENVGDRIMALTAKRGVDAVIEVDLAANAGLLPNVLAPNGVVAIYGSGAPEASIPFQFLLTNNIALKFFLVYLMPPEERARATADITGMLERGALVHNVAQAFDLNDIVAAHEAVEAGKALGNIIVSIA